MVLLCITAVVALPDCLGVFWISKKRGGVILLVYPPQVVHYLIPFEGSGRDSPREAAAACELGTRRGDVGGIQIHLLQPGVPILPASWNAHGTATEVSKGCPSSLGHPVPSWGWGWACNTIAIFTLSWWSHLCINNLCCAASLPLYFHPLVLIVANYCFYYWVMCCKYTKCGSCPVRAGLGANAWILPLNVQPNCTALPGMLFFGIIAPKVWAF